MIQRFDFAKNQIVYFCHSFYSFLSFWEFWEHHTKIMNQNTTHGRKVRET